MTMKNENLEIERIFYLRETENAWRRSLLKPNDPSWLEIFPEAKDFIPLKIAEWQEQADQIANSIKTKLLNLKIIASNTFGYWFFREWLKINAGTDLVQAQNHIKRLKRLITKPSQRNILSGNQIFAAKSVPLSEIVDIQLRKAGKNYFGLCPFHEERHASFYIYSESNTFVCFGCQEKGDAISYVMKTKNLNFKEAVLWLLKG
jgi:hypothetical protein